MNNKKKHTNQSTKNSFKHNFQHYAQLIRVPSGFILTCFYLYYSYPTPKLLISGFFIALFGVGIRAWASGHLRKNESLSITGPYLLTRNPLYLGSLLIGIGCSVAGRSFLIAAILVIFFTLIYLPVMKAETRHLSKLFPIQYNDYATQVPLFVPRLSKFLDAIRTQYDFQLYLRYREYRALIGLLCVFSFLLTKLLYWM